MTPGSIPYPCAIDLILSASALERKLAFKGASESEVPQKVCSISSFSS